MLLFDSILCSSKGLLGQVVKKSASYYEVSHQQSASVRILLVPIWMWESLSVYLWKVCGVSRNTLYLVSGFSLPPIKIDRHHITEKLFSMAKNSKQINSSSNLELSKMTLRDLDAQTLVTRNNCYQQHLFLMRGLGDMSSDGRTEEQMDRHNGNSMFLRFFFFLILQTEHFCTLISESRSFSVKVIRWLHHEMYGCNYISNTVMHLRLHAYQNLPKLSEWIRSSLA
jgi:hypothetical protein